jgi:hypothetical protein
VIQDGIVPAGKPSLVQCVFTMDQNMEQPLLHHVPSELAIDRSGDMSRPPVVCPVSGHPLAGLSGLELLVPMNSIDASFVRLMVEFAEGRRRKRK